jgi:hypothetical protein
MSEKPPDIKKSITAGNTEHLRAAGRKGAEVTNRNKDLLKTLAEIEALERQLEDETMRKTANEHIISPDGEDQDYTPED